MNLPAFHRRRALTGVAGFSLALPVLAACGSDETGTRPRGGAPFTTTSDIPVGGGTIFEDHEVVVTQPTEGEFKAFSSICTHQGCPVGRVEDGTIQCPCHGSKFAIADGSVTDGPATEPLPELPLSIEGEDIGLA